MNTFKDRLLDEREELDRKIGKLRNFFTTSNFTELNREHSNLLEIQFDTMEQYLLILEMRLDLIE